MASLYLGAKAFHFEIIRNLTKPAAGHQFETCWRNVIAVTVKFPLFDLFQKAVHFGIFRINLQTEVFQLRQYI